MHVVQALVALNIGGSELVSVELCEHLASLNQKVTIIAADGPLGERVRASGAHHVDWPIGRKRLTTLRYIGRLADWMNENRPDIVHVHSRLPAWILWRAIQRMETASRPAFLTTMHGHYSVSFYSSVMARGKRVIAVSDHIRNYTQKNYPGTDPSRIVTVHGGASRTSFPYAYQPPDGWRESVCREFPELTGRRWLCMPGRVTRWKGHVEFLNLVASLVGDHPEIHGVCVGGCRTGSRYQAELESLAQQLGLENRITFTGNRLDMRDWMTASEMVFNLSFDPPEAFGRTVLEALCLGRPVIAWNHGGAAEIVARMFPEGAVPPRDTGMLLARTREFLAREPKVAKSDAFSLAESMQKTFDVYRELTSEQPLEPSS